MLLIVMIIILPHIGVAEVLNYDNLKSRDISNNTSFIPINLPISNEEIKDDVNKSILRSNSEINLLLAIPKEKRNEENTILYFDTILTRIDISLNKYSVLSKVYEDKNLIQASNSASRIYSSYLEDVFRNITLMYAIENTPYKSESGSALKESELQSFRMYGADLSNLNKERLTSLNQEQELLKDQYLENIRINAPLSDNLLILSKRAEIQSEIAQLLGYQNYKDLLFDQKGLDSKEVSNLSYPKAIVSHVTEMMKPVMAGILLIKQKDDPGASDIYDYEIQELLKKESQSRLGLLMENITFSGSSVILRSLNIISYLLDLNVNLVPRAPVYAKGVLLYRVSEKGTNKTLGWFYLDLHKRPEKTREWMTARLTGAVTIDDVISNTPVYLVSGSVPGDQELLFRPEDLNNLFHEFGHVFSAILVESRDSEGFNAGLPVEMTETPSYFFEFLLWTPEIFGYIVMPDKDSIRSLPGPVMKDLIRTHSPFSLIQQWNLAYQLVISLVDYRIVSSNSKIRLCEWYDDYLHSITGVMVTDQGGSILSHPHFVDDTAGLYWIYPTGELYATYLYTRFTYNGIFNRSSWSEYKDMLQGSEKCIVHPEKLIQFSNQSETQFSGNESFSNSSDRMRWIFIP